MTAYKAGNLEPSTETARSVSFSTGPSSQPETGRGTRERGRRYKGPALDRKKTEVTHVEMAIYKGTRSPAVG